MCSAQGEADAERSNAQIASLLLQALSLWDLRDVLGERRAGDADARGLSSFLRSELAKELKRLRLKQQSMKADAAELEEHRACLEEDELWLLSLEGRLQEELREPFWSC